MAIADVLQPVALCAAFWLAVARLRGEARAGQVAGLALGAAFGHAGWLLLHADRLTSVRELLADPLRGYCVLFVPLGPALVAALQRDAAARRAFAAEAARVLPAALLCARVGCVLAGCCGGVPFDRTIDGGGLFDRFAEAVGGGRHPTALYDAAGLLALDLGMRRARSERQRIALFAIGFGAIRLAVESWRASPPLGEPWIEVENVAGLWVAAGLVAALRERRALRTGGRRRPAYGPALGGTEGGLPPSSFSSFSRRPRTGGVRHMRNVPFWRSSRS